MSDSEDDDEKYDIYVSDDDLRKMLLDESKEEEEEKSLSFEEAAKKKAKEEAEEIYKKSSLVGKLTVAFFEEERAKKQAEEEAKKQAEAEGLNPFNRRQTDNDYWSDIDVSIFDSNEDDNDLYGSDNSMTLINDNNDEDMGKQKNLLENEKTRNSDDNDDKKKNTFDRSIPFDQYRKDTINEAKKNFFEKSKKKITKTNFINLEKNRQFLYPKVSGIPISTIFQITKKNMKLQLAKYKRRRRTNTKEKDVAKLKEKIEMWKTWRKSNNVEGWKNVLLGLLEDAILIEKEIIYETLILFLVKDDPDEAIDYAAKMTNQENKLNINKKEYIYKDEYQKVYQRNTKALIKKYSELPKRKKQKLKLQECMSNLKF